MNKQNQDRSFIPVNTEYFSNKKDLYEGHEEIPGEDPSAQKFNIPMSLAENLKTLSEIEGTNKTDIVKRALYAYFSQSHFWNNKKYFLKTKDGSSKPIEYEDLIKEGDSTRITVMWCDNEDDPREKWLFIACRIILLKKSTVVINPVFYLNQPNQEASLEKSGTVKPDFYEFNPYLPSAPPLLNNLKFELPYRYIWSILPN